MSQATSRGETGPNTQCHGGGEKCLTVNPANLEAHGLQLNIGKETDTQITDQLTKC